MRLHHLLTKRNQCAQRAMVQLKNGLMMSNNNHNSTASRGGSGGSRTAAAQPPVGSAPHVRGAASAATASYLLLHAASVALTGKLRFSRGPLSLCGRGEKGRLSQSRRLVESGRLLPKFGPDSPLSLLGSSCIGSIVFVYHSIARRGI